VGEAEIARESNSPSPGSVTRSDYRRGEPATAVPDEARALVAIRVDCAYRPRVQMARPESSDPPAPVQLGQQLLKPGVRPEGSPQEFGVEVAKGQGVVPEEWGGPAERLQGVVRLA
jgi:hypothetical protein